MVPLLRPPFALVALAGLTFASSSVVAQAVADNPVNGKALFEDTPSASGINSLTSSCTNCHGDIEERRAKVSGSSAESPAITFDRAMTRLTQALQIQPGMATFKQLDVEQVRDLAAYIADTPKASATALSFSAAAMTTSAPQPVVLTAPAAPRAPLIVTDIAIAGTGAASFSRTFECDGKTFTAAETCSFGVRFSPVNTSAANPVLTVSMKEGPTGAVFTRRVVLNGTATAGAPAPAPAPAPVPAPSPAPAPTPPVAEEDEGGGAMGVEALLALAAACAAASVARRRG